MRRSCDHDPAQGDRQTRRSQVSRHGGYLLAGLPKAGYARRWLHERLEAIRSEPVEAVHDRIATLLSIKGRRTITSFHRELGQIMWDYCGMERTADGLMKALQLVADLQVEFWRNVTVTGHNEQLNQALEHAGRVADFFELAQLMCIDALHREESCGCHFRAESQTEDDDALRDDDRYSYVAAWEFTGAGRAPVLHKEQLEYEYVQLQQRSYK